MLPDVQLLKPEVPIGLSRVGATGIKKLVQVEREGKRPIILISSFNVYVDLPSSRKGANLSRNFEAVDEVIERLTAKPVKRIEDLTVAIADELLLRHEYATRAEVNMVSELIMRKKSPSSSLRTQEVVKIFSDALRWRNGGKKVFIGVEVAGITVCPCAQELVRSEAARKLEEMGIDAESIPKILEAVPVASHNQRGRAMVKIEVRDDFTASIDQLMKIAKTAMSGEIYEILKREDELMVVEKAHMNPRFVEDSVRLMAKTTLEFFPEAPDDIAVVFRQVNEESIHQHDVVAERIATIGELRNEVASL